MPTRIILKNGTTIDLKNKFEDVESVYTDRDLHHHKFEDSKGKCVRVLRSEVAAILEL